MVTSRRILVLGLEFHQLRWSAGTQRRRRFRSCDLQLAATFLLGEDASGAAAISRKLMYLDPCEPRNRTEQIALLSRAEISAHSKTFSCSGKHCAIPFANVLTLLTAIKQY